MLEWWNIDFLKAAIFFILGIDAICYQIIISISQTDYSIVPELQHSHWATVLFIVFA